MLDELAEHWRRSPDMRLMQVISNLAELIVSREAWDMPRLDTVAYNIKDESVLTLLHGINEGYKARLADAYRDLGVKPHNKRLRDVMHLDRRFVVVVDPPDADDHTWNAHIIGVELDNVSFGPTPQAALDQAATLVSMLVGACPKGEQHEWLHDPDPTTDLPYRCRHCDERANEGALEDIP